LSPGYYDKKFFICSIYLFLLYKKFFDWCKWPWVPHSLKYHWTLANQPIMSKGDDVPQLEKEDDVLKETMKVIQRTKLERFNSGGCTNVLLLRLCTKRERTLEKFNN